MSGTVHPTYSSLYVYFTGEERAQCQVSPWFVVGGGGGHVVLLELSGLGDRYMYNTLYVCPSHSLSTFARETGLFRCQASPWFVGGTTTWNREHTPSTTTEETTL